MIGSSFFIGWTATTLIIPPLADKIGRKWIYRASIVFTFLPMIIMAFSRSIDLTICMMFIAGAMTAGRVTVGYIYGSEFLTNKWRILFGTLLMFIDGGSVCLSAIYFDWVSKHAIYFEFIGIISSAICFVLHMLFIPESPIF